MTKNNHHYVPRFYLRFFGIDPNYIQLFNVKDNLLVPKAPIKHQCVKRKFYGKEDKVENILSEIESKHSIVLKTVIREGRMPDKYSDDYKSIIEFVALQLLRTKSMVDIINKVMGGFTNTLKTEFPDEINLLVDSLNKDIQNPVLISLQLMGVIMNSISDLSHQLFYLGPKHELVTSDTPVVKYNLYNQAIQQRGLTGTQNKGITLFIPLSPKYLLVLYDSNVYTLSKDVGPENITVKDVEAINFLQFVFCDENVYFRSAVPVDKLKRYAKKARIFRKAEQPITEIFEEVENKNSSLIVQRVITPNLQLALSFIRVKKSARKVSYKNRINDMYRGELPDLTEKFSRPEHPVIFREKKKKTV